MKSPSEDEKDFRARILEDIRPWGKFRSYPRENSGAVKIITVNPGASLSLQLHRRRAEFWIALDDGLEVTVGGRVWRPRRNEEIYIPREAPHRLRGLGPEAARVMEIWLGDSAEDDIVRLADDYGRAG
jgi:mannose-6-phosphate isomerase-like protein (cupin superfamily)